MYQLFARKRSRYQITQRKDTDTPKNTDADNRVICEKRSRCRIKQKKTRITHKKDADNPKKDADNPKKDADNPPQKKTQITVSPGGGGEQFRKVGRAQGLGLCASDSGFRVQGLGFDVPLKGSIRVTIGIYKGTIL